jgi:hypothetical protein
MSPKSRQFQICGDSFRPVPDANIYMRRRMNVVGQSWLVVALPIGGIQRSLWVRRRFFGMNLEVVCKGMMQIQL